MALEDRAAKNDILIGDTPKAIRRRGRLDGLKASGRLWKHSTLADIHGIVSQDDMRDYFVLTLVRNPWDRMVSYYHWLKHQGFDHSAVGLAKAMEFGEFLRDERMQASFRSSPYSRYVTDKEGINHSNLYVRLENLDTDLGSFEDHLGFKLTPLNKANPSQRDSGYRQYFNSNEAELVAEFCSADIEQFGYEF